MRENLEKKRMVDSDNEAAICGYKRLKKDVGQKAMSDLY
jgi:hypothetical protein